MSDSKKTSQYAQSGVSGAGAENALSGLLKHVLPTRDFNPNYPSRINIGYFANVLDIGNGQGIAFCTDGVGTKILVAEMLDRYDTIGIDCIAMNVNDLICVGARPVSMVDYIACSFTDARIFEELGRGLAEGARQSGISIAGGEISQIREIISGIDLIGAAIGHVAIDKINTGKHVAPGDVILGLESSGVHSNGLTLARKVLLGDTPDEQKSNATKHSPDLGMSFGEALLIPTRIYVPPVMELLDAGVDLKAMVHITSGGYGNLNRVEANDIRFVIDNHPETPAVFRQIQERGGVSDAEMFEVFNMGIGLCLVANESQVDAITATCKKHNLTPHKLGHIESHTGKEVHLPTQNLTARGQSFT